MKAIQFWLDLHKLSSPLPDLAVVILAFAEIAVAVMILMPPVLWAARVIVAPWWGYWLS